MLTLLRLRPHRFMIVTVNREQIVVVLSNDPHTDVFVCELMRETHPLRLMLYRLTIHNRMLELLHNGLVYGIALTHCQSLRYGKSGLLTKSSTEHAFFLSTTGVL